VSDFIMTRRQYLRGGPRPSHMAYGSMGILRSCVMAFSAANNEMYRSAED
jgi:hypothetical protein